MVSNTIVKYYIPIQSKDANYLKVELYYDIGGYNYFTCKETRRGYFLSITPVDRSDKGGYFTESITLFRGVKQMILPVDRKSEKSAQTALGLYKKEVRDLIRYVVDSDNGNIIVDEEYLDEHFPKEDVMANV